MRIHFIGGLVVMYMPLWAAMPPAEQNALVRKYCAVCHTDAAKNGGLSLEHYDAAKRDPPLAAMILSKLNNGAMGAAGNGVPDKTARHFWLQSTHEQAVGSTKWFVSGEGGVVSASIVREVPPRKAGVTDIPLYRIMITCEPETGAGEMQLTWSPEPQTGRTITATWDGNAPVEYKIDGTGTMGNGATAQTGRASLILNSGTRGKVRLPNQTLRIHDVFPGETVEFPFSGLDEWAYSELRKCF